MLTLGRTIILVISSLLLAVVLTTAVLLLNNNLSSPRSVSESPTVVAYTPVAEWQSSITPTPTYITPSAKACVDNPLYETITSIHTVGDMLTKLGQPEKVKRWRQGGEENLLMRYGNEYLYTTKGVNFLPPFNDQDDNTTPDPNIVPDKTSYAYLTDPQAIDPQTPISYECYAPTDYASYRRHVPQYAWDGDPHYGEDYLDWPTPR